ncbi:Piso0_002175 [Millerozyma farinosa CBS 7064]|uniref:Piso0_002175 protein n=1 Tax=Pichia sorbitophila (strain ATCC MYA-4447 / BCRC 22081 / CBS 7064 / NBRC 10061 / NRRL Y-12695) TaxID=559304 RepID=G8YBW7_PICSO|nr:Piso0_002175 [Millerozyma farinosa CBS 7064]
MDGERIPGYKVVILGDTSVGKTSLVHRFLKNEFNEHTANTIGAAFITVDHNSNVNPNKRVRLEIWDTAGQERYRSLTPMYYRNAKAALVCFDLSSVDTFEKAQYWLEQLSLNSSSEDTKKYIVGTKSDKIAEAEEIDHVKDRLDDTAVIFETSAKTGQGINQLFDKLVDDVDEQIFDEFNKRCEEELRRESENSMINVLSKTVHNKYSCC